MLNRVFNNEVQERFEWYKVKETIDSINQAAKNIGLHPQELVHIGGTAVYYRMKETYGPQATFHFRGTHDADLLVFRTGYTKSLIDEQIRIGQESKTITSIGLERSLSLPDKYKALIKFNTDNFPGSLDHMEIDYYEPHDSRSQNIIFNHRIMNSKKIITDKPEILNLKNDGYVAVPTITDAIILKTDIIKFSESGLREKDKADIAVLFNIAIKKKMHIDNIIDELMRVQDNHVDRIKILNEIKSLLSTTFRSQFKSEFFPNKEDSIKIEALLNRQLVMFEPFVNKPGQNRIYKKTSR